MNGMDGWIRLIVGFQPLMVISPTASCRCVCSLWMGRPHQPPMYSGAWVPQGTMFGPLLFLLYINDISTAINSPMRLFADDTCLMYHAWDQVPSRSSHIAGWHQQALRWEMNFNVTKCAVMSLSTRKVLQYDNIMNAQLIPRVQKHDYLGDTISSSLTWKDQCTKVGNKANHTLGIVKRIPHAAARSVRKPMRCWSDLPWNMWHAPGHHTLEGQTLSRKHPVGCCQIRV